MQSYFARYKTLAIVLTVLSVCIIYIIYQLLKVPKKLDVYQPVRVDKELVDTTVQYVKKYHSIAPFELINQNGDTITAAHYDDKIYVADFFFTTCQTICPIMTDHMVQIQEKLKDDAEVLLLSHSVIPEYDTPEVLKKYAVKKGIDDSRWNLVTGSRNTIYALARKSYLVAKDVPGGNQEMVHTENFVLVDKKRQIRGFYDGTLETDINRLLEDIAILKAEYAPPKTWWEKLF